MSEGIYSSPFVEDGYYIGENHVASPIYTDAELATLLEDPEGLEKGFIHTFQNETEAMDYMKKYIKYITPPGTSRTYAVLECKIPATAKYILKGKYTSIFFCTALNCYGSSEIQVCREVGTCFWEDTSSYNVPTD